MSDLFVDVHTPDADDARRLAVEALVARLGAEAAAVARTDACATDCVLFGRAEHVTALVDPAARALPAGTHEQLVVLSRRVLIDRLVALGRPRDAAKVALGPAAGMRVLVCAVDGAVAVSWTEGGRG